MPPMTAPDPAQMLDAIANAIAGPLGFTARHHATSAVNPNNLLLHLHCGSGTPAVATIARQELADAAQRGEQAVWHLVRLRIRRAISDSLEAQWSAPATQDPKR